MAGGSDGETDDENLRHHGSGMIRNGYKDDDGGDCNRR